MRKKPLTMSFQGMHFFGSDAERSYKEAGRQRNLRFWVHSSFAFATSETSVSGHATELQAS